MAVSAGVAYVDIKPNLKGFEGELEKTTKPMLERVSTRMHTVGRTLTKSVTLPLVGFGVLGVKMASDVDKGLREVNTLFGLTGRAAEESFAQLKAGVAGLSQEVGVAQDVLAQGLYQAISAGVPRENVFEFMQVAARAAIAGVTDTETAIDGITTVINAFGLSAEDAQSVADSMFTAVKGGKTTFDELSAALFQVAPAAAAAGVSMEEVNAAVATLTAGGTPTSVATTQIRAALVGLQRPSENMNAIFEKLGYRNAQAAIEAKGLTFALGAVTDAAAGDAGQLQTLLGSVEAVAAAQVIAGTGAEKMASELANQQDKAGATQTAFEEMEKSASRRFDRLKVSMGNLAVEAGNALLPAVESLVGMFSTLTGWFANLGPEAKRLVGIFAIAAAAIGPLLIIGAKLITSFRVIRTAFIALRATMLFNPWTAIIVATIALVVVIVKNWDTIKGVLLAAWNWIKDTAGAIWGAIFGVLSGVWEGIRDAAVAVFDAIRDFFVRWWKVLLLVFGGPLGYLILMVIKHWDTIKAVTAAVWDAITGALRAAWEAIVAVALAVWEPLAAFFSVLWDGITAVLTTAWDGIKAVADTVWGAITGVIEAFIGGLEPIFAGAQAAWDFLTGGFEAVRDTIGDVFDWIVERIQDAIDWVKENADKLLGPIDEIVGGVSNVAGVVGGGIAKGLGALSPFQHGGPFRAGQPMLVGERGPELAVFDRGGAIVPNYQLGGLAGASGHNISVTLNGARMSARDVADELGWLMRTGGR